MNWDLLAVPTGNFVTLQIQSLALILWSKIICLMKEPARNCKLVLNLTVPLLHQVHHTYSSTSALTAEYSGAWETLSLGLFAAANPVFLGCHPLTELAFFLLNIWLSVEDHCGYDLPWATHRLVPLGLYGGARHHDLHHLKSKCNFAPYFTHWDQLVGTLQTSQD